MSILLRPSSSSYEKHWYMGVQNNDDASTIEFSDLEMRFHVEKKVQEDMNYYFDLPSVQGEWSMSSGSFPAVATYSASSQVLQLGKYAVGSVRMAAVKAKEANNERLIA